MWLFGKRDIDTLIFDYAEKQRPSDMRLLIKMILKADLYAPIIKGLPNVPTGTKYITKTEDCIQIQTVNINGNNLVLFYTSKDDKRLGTSFISMTGCDAFNMVLRSSTDGILIQNARVSWFGLSRDGVADALKTI